MSAETCRPGTAAFARRQNATPGPPARSSTAPMPIATNKYPETHWHGSTDSQNPATWHGETEKKAVPTTSTVPETPIGTVRVSRTSARDQEQQLAPLLNLARDEKVIPGPLPPRRPGEDRKG